MYVYHIQCYLCMQVREMEAKLKQYGISEMTTNPQDFISRKDHARICDARVSAREADLQVTILLPCCTTVCLSAHEADLQVTVLCFVCLSICLFLCRGSRPAGLCLALCQSACLCSLSIHLHVRRPVILLTFFSAPCLHVCQSDYSNTADEKPSYAPVLAL